MKDIFTSINDGDFKVQIHYPSKPKSPKFTNVSPSVEEAEQYILDIQDYTERLKEYEFNKSRYSEQSAICEERFRKALREFYGTTKLKNEDVLYSHAYDKGHSGGHHEIASCYSYFVDFLEAMNK